MPHLTIEHSQNLTDSVDVQALCDDLHAVILASGLFEIGAIRVRAISCAHYAIADKLGQNCFVDMSFRVGRGRSLEERKAVGDALIEAAQKRLASLLAKPNFALSLEIREIDPELSWKKNTMHPRLRAEAQ